MTKLVSLLGLLVALSLGGIAWVGLPVTDSMASQSPALTTGCAGDIALDEGYGVTRRVACPQR